MKIVSENRFSGKAYFYTIASRLSVDDAFLYEGRRRGYISVEALAALSNEQVGISIHMLDF